MELTRSRFLALLGGGAAGLAGAALAGCAKAPPPLDTAAADFRERAHGTVDVWCRGGLVGTSEPTVAAFHAAQDRVRIRLTPVPDGMFVTKLATAIRGGRMPDLVDIDVINSAAFVHRGAFADLTPLLEELPYRDRLSPGHLALAKRDGRYYGVPSIADNSALWCNQALLDRAKVSVDDATGSFEGYLEAARAVRGLGKDFYGWYLPGNGSGGLAFTVQPHIWAGGEDLVTGGIGSQRAHIAGNEPLRRTLKFLHTLWRERLMPRDCFSDDGARWTAAFYAGKVAMLPSGYNITFPKAPKALRDDLAVRLLSGPDGGHAFFAGGNNFGIPNGARNPEGAWDFVRFCLTVRRQGTLPAAGMAPVRSDAATPAFRKKYPLAVAPLTAIDSGRAPLALAYNRIFNQNDGPWLAMLRRATFGGEVEQAMREAQQRFDEVLRQGDA
ncbi:sugar ABC transporter substrate-binding protein [Streptomyces sp. A7024]|uniref:Sugar ABC transporter substrate-binding protein n=1 Tax=Streptomyces coryli TaxID=1128680 RepID=A0A6G4TYS3_9ACTN|nr:sugar ABC transporter substrate-binding protein [Streptomyces coryli]NGN64177.1 sugar ABC transporter substrate-binding protein [Streptomyces coryli]